MIRFAGFVLSKEKETPFWILDEQEACGRWGTMWMQEIRILELGLKVILIF
jgi:hypothetical protein